VSMDLRRLSFWMLIFVLLTPGHLFAVPPSETVVVEASPYKPTLISFEQARVGITVPIMPLGTMLTLQEARTEFVAGLTGNNQLIGTPFRFLVMQAGAHLPELDTDFMLSVVVPGVSVLPSALGLYYYHEPLGVWQRVLGEFNADTSTIEGRFRLTGLFALLVDMTPPEPLTNVTVQVRENEASLAGIAEPFAFLQLFAGNQFLGDTQADVRGHYRLARNLPSGQYILRLRQIDQAGNMSEQSLALTRTPESAVHIELVVGSAQATVNRTLLMLDVPPRIVQGRTIVPLRFIADALGATVTWHEAEQRVTVTYETTTVYFYIGSPAVSVNGREVLLDVAPFIMNGRTLVPLRFLAETFGFEVLWHGLTNRIELRK